MKFPYFLSFYILLVLNQGYSEAQEKAMVDSLETLIISLEIDKKRTGTDIRDTTSANKLLRLSKRY